MDKELNKDQVVDELKYEDIALEDVVYGNQHALNVLLDILIEKNVISEQEFKDRLDQIIDESPDVDEVSIKDSKIIDE